MEEITIRGTKAQRNLMEWSRRVADCRSSGMSVTRWCTEHNVKLKTYYNWQKECWLLIFDYSVADFDRRYFTENGLTQMAS